jgi:hypothetical protein
MKYGDATSSSWKVTTGFLWDPSEKKRENHADVASGNFLQFAIEHGPSSSFELPNIKMVSFQR